MAQQDGTPEVRDPLNGTPGLLTQHPVAGTGAYSFGIAERRVRAIFVVRNPDRLRGVVEHMG